MRTGVVAASCHRGWDSECLPLRHHGTVTLPMSLERAELFRVAIPLVSPFRTSFGVTTEKEALIIRVEMADGSHGWGECVADSEPLYSSEYTDGCQQVITDHLLPRLFGAGSALTGESVGALFAPVRQHYMAKACLEMAVLDAQLRRAGVSLAAYLGATREQVPSGVSIGLQGSPEALVEAAGRYLDAGYLRVKIKIEPSADVALVRAMRSAYPHVPLQVDANAAYDLADLDHLAALDEFNLLLIEQPLAEDDLAGHAAVARQITTPICLDESIVSARSAAYALDLGACSVINIKAGRVGGYLEAQRIHDLCLHRGVAVWCGGMLETGLGRAANLALAALPGFTLPGDTSASNRYFVDDITEPFTLVDGHLAVPTGPGIGIEPRPERLREAVVQRSEVRR
jgi:O-succinylbenzoate synthase